MWMTWLWENAVLLQSGDKIPADGILVDGDLRVDNSALNGEAEECKKTAAPDGAVLPEDITGDTWRRRVVRCSGGAVVFDGEGVLAVQRVGLKTMMGRMAEEMQEEEPASPLQVKLGKLAPSDFDFRLYRSYRHRASLYDLFHRFGGRPGGISDVRLAGHLPRMWWKRSLWLSSSSSVPYLRDSLYR